jgi:cell division ATPase FtsA
MNKAEKLKKKFGSALAECIVDNRIITIPSFNGRDYKEILEKNLALIIQPGWKRSLNLSELRSRNPDTNASSSEESY